MLYKIFVVHLRALTCVTSAQQRFYKNAVLSLTSILILLGFSYSCEDKFLTSHRYRIITVFLIEKAKLLLLQLALTTKAEVCNSNISTMFPVI
ncbi:hypothetical protein NIES267_60830 [Calothrix parasitica NIES-267]|uniref:Uncharacterized protein n=1 Tax=Calothrix parasitica NIES-267 TaxID=1973488 RepID=A0A1Z4LZC1_9CYAN|nr:hypothetical protein NIES267_60830 [Calothrix parasitica NIES-267]